MINQINITRDDLTIEYGVASWGGPTAIITVNREPLEGRVYWLRSTYGLDNDTTRDLRKGGGIHLYASDPDGRYNDWRGAFKTFDMDEAINDLVEYINEEAVRKVIEDVTWQHTSDLTDAVTAFTDAINGTSRRDWRKQWQWVQETVAGLDMKIREITNV